LSTRRIKVDVSDQEGNKFTVTFQGKVTRQKVLQLLDLIEILGGAPPSTETSEHFSDESKIGKVAGLVEERFPVGWFSSKDVQSTYHDVYGEAITLSTVSTYLNRLVQKGILHKTGSARKQYKLKQQSTFDNSIKVTQ